jgi:hypothetical protein
VSLARVGFIAIPAGAAAGFDHADVFRSERRMYVAHTGANRIDVLDRVTRTYLHSLPDLPRSTTGSSRAKTKPIFVT